MSTATWTHKLELGSSGTIILGHSERGWWETFWRGDVISRFIREVEDVRVVSWTLS